MSKETGYLMYVPSQCAGGKKYPLLVALHPGADAASMITVWKDCADRHRMIIFASCEFRNGLDMNEMLPKIAATLKTSIIPRYPVDQARIIATGLSGGGMGSHALAFHYPALISAVIINTGMMNEYYREHVSVYPQGKRAVFLASPTDFRYGEMKRDRKLLESLHWKTRWIEFEGGHTFAPKNVCDEAVTWLLKSFDAPEEKR